MASASLARPSWLSLIHISELLADGESWIETYPAGKTVKAEIIHIDSHERKISLSERGAEERSAGDVESYMQSQSDSSARLGDVMGDLGRKLADVDTPEGDDGAEATE